MESTSTTGGRAASRAQSLAARAAAKRATLKALGLPLGFGLEAQIEIPLPGPNALSPARMELAGAVARRARSLGLDEPIVSLSHIRNLGVALVVLPPAPSRAGRTERPRKRKEERPASPTPARKKP